MSRIPRNKMHADFNKCREVFPDFSHHFQVHLWREIIIIIIIIDIYPGSSTHSKVVFREVLHPIELEFGNVDF